MRHSEAYLAWRESEAYQVPMTEEGEEEAQKRWYNFRKGWNAAVKACALTCEELKAPDIYNTDDKDMWDIATLDCEEAILELESK